jgi:hypothetical protein
MHASDLLNTKLGVADRLTAMTAIKDVIPGFIDDFELHVKGEEDNLTPVGKKHLPIADIFANNRPGLTASWPFGVFPKSMVPSRGPASLSCLRTRTGVDLQQATQVNRPLMIRTKVRSGWQNKQLDSKSIRAVASTVSQNRWTTSLATGVKNRTRVLSMTWHAEHAQIVCGNSLAQTTWASP